MIVIAKNQTAGALALDQLPVPDNEIPASGQVILTAYASIAEIQQDPQLLAHIVATDAIVNVDGVDLSTADSEAFVSTVPNTTFTDTEDGLTPASGGGSTNFLRADGSWATPAGGVSGPQPIVSLTSTDDASTFSQSTPLVIEWDVERYKDSGFTHSTSTNPSRAYVDQDGTYQIAASLRSSSSAQRAQPVARILINGSIQAQPYGSGYIRNNGSSSDYWSAVVNPPPVKLSAGDYVEVQIQVESQMTVVFTPTLLGSESSFSVTALTGEKGDQGAPGPAATHAPTHSEGGTDPITVENLATGSTTTTHVLSPDGTGGLVMRAESSAGGSVVTDCPFGAKSDSLGKFLIANGKSSDPDDSTKQKTRQPITYTGTITRLAYQTKEATSSTVMKIHINGSVEATILFSSINANFGGVETTVSGGGPLSISVTAGDYAEIEYDASDKPGECTMKLGIEVS
jgi:hypothetical protein